MHILSSIRRDIVQMRCAATPFSIINLLSAMLSHYPSISLPGRTFAA
jgi:hypothetical protein